MGNKNAMPKHTSSTRALYNNRSTNTHHSPYPTANTTGTGTGTIPSSSSSSATSTHNNNRQFNKNNVIDLTTHNGDYHTDITDTINISTNATVAMLCDMGFTLHVAQLAVHSVGNNIEHCIEYINNNIQLLNEQDASTDDTTSVTATGDPYKSTQWMCSICTYINTDIALTQCIMCDTKRLYAINQQTTEQCIVCFDSFNSNDLTSNLSCQHSICKLCMRQYLLNSIDTATTYNLKCVEPSCNNKITPIVVQSILDLDTYNRYMKQYESERLNNDPSVRWCSTIDCNTPLYGTTNSPRIKCHKCNQYTCFNCRITWHYGYSCHDIQQQLIDNKTRDADNEFINYCQLHPDKYRQCYKCGIMIEKRDGCDKMTCRCGGRMCMKCGSINARCTCTSDIHSFYDQATVLNNWSYFGNNNSYTRRVSGLPIILHQSPFSQLFNSSMLQHGLFR